MTFVLAVLWALQASEPKSPEAALKAIQKDFEQFSQKFQQDYEKAKTQEEKNKLFETRRSGVRAFVKRALQLAQDHPKGSAAFEALEWIITGGLGYFPETWQALDLVQKEHLLNPKLGQICARAAIYRLLYGGTETLLRTVMAKHPERDVQGIACYTLAGVLQDYASSAEYNKDPAKAKRNEAFFPSALFQKLKTYDPEKLRQESESLYQQSIDKYGDVMSPGRKRSLGQLAEAALFRLRHLQVGKVAPDIDGEDIDGKWFKLSDYRGKVVVLDFWGHW